MSNKREFLALAALAVMLLHFVCAPSLRAQTAFDFGARAGITLDKKIFTGFHLCLSEEARLNNNLSSFDKLCSELSVSYKFNDYLKADAFYAYRLGHDPEEQEEEWSAKHRYGADLTESYKYGPWKFSLRQTAMATVRTDAFNAYQQPRIKAAARLRGRVSYAIYSARLIPFLSDELEWVLNGAAFEYGAESATRMQFRGYDEAYYNRNKLTLGVEYKLLGGNSLEFYILLVSRTGRIIDARKNGTLKEVIHPSDNFLSLGVTYNLGL